jgi:hypothetical protein
MHPFMAALADRHSLERELGQSGMAPFTSPMT